MHCKSLIGELRESQQSVLKDKKASSSSFLPHQEDAAFAQIAACALAYQLTCRLHQNLLPVSKLSNEIDATITPWLDHAKTKGEEATIACDALFRLYHGLVKAPDAITGLIQFFFCYYLLFIS